MQTGRLRHLISIWTYVDTNDEFGEPIKTYEKLADAFAEIRPLVGTETYNEKMVHTEHTHKIMTRYFHFPLNSTMQIRYDEVGDGSNIRVFEVDGAPSNFVERNIYWQFNCKEVFDNANYN